ncbi:MAG: VOC family protein [Planctomycetota bacterium]
MPDVGLTHIALPVSDLDRSIDFYARYAAMKVVHRRTKTDNPDEGVVWLSDLTRQFALVLSDGHPVVHPLAPFAHLGVACESREEVERLCAEARAEGVPVDGPTDSGPPVGYWAFLRDPDGHTLELTFDRK